MKNKIGNILVVFGVGYAVIGIYKLLVSLYRYLSWNAFVKNLHDISVQYEEVKPEKEVELKKV